MLTIPVKTRLEPDGSLNLHVPTNLPASDVDVLIVLQPVQPQTAAWPAGFFEQTYGSFAEHPLERASQGTFERRSDLL